MKNQNPPISAQNIPVEQPQPIIPPSPVILPIGGIKPKFNLPILIVGIIIFLILIATVSAAYLFALKSKPKTQPTKQIVQTLPTPTIDQTANWKIYTNQQYKYSFKYPDNRYLFDESVSSASGLDPETFSESHIWFCPTKKLEDCAFQTNIFQVFVFSNPKNINLDDWIMNSDKSPFRPQPTLPCYFNDPRTQKYTGNFLGHDSRTYKYFIDEQTAKNACKGIPMEGGGEFQTTFFIENGKIFEVSIYQASKENFPELQQVFSTFKFTN